MAIRLKSQMQPQNESLLGAAGRNVARVLPEAFGRAYGTPGDIIDLLTNLGNYGIKKATGYEDIIPQIAGKYIPTSENLINAAKNKQREVHGEGFEVPHNDLERMLSSAAQTAGGIAGGGALGSLFGLGGTAANLGKQALQGGVGAAVGGQLGKSAFGEEWRPIFEGIGAITPELGKSLFNTLNPYRLKNKSSELYNLANDLMPEKPFKASPLRTIVGEMEDELLHGKAFTSPAEREFLRDKVEHIKNAITHNEITPQELIRNKKGWNSAIENLKYDQKFERKWLKRLSNAANKTLEANKPQAPGFVNAYLSADDMWKSYADRLSVGNVLKKVIPKEAAQKGSALAYASVPLYKFFTAGLIPGAKVGAAIGAGALGAEVLNVGRNIARSKTMRRYYGNILKAAAQNNEAKILSSFNNLARAYNKEVPQPKVRLKSQLKF